MPTPKVFTAQIPLPVGAPDRTILDWMFSVMPFPVRGFLNDQKTALITLQLDAAIQPVLPCGLLRL